MPNTNLNPPELTPQDIKRFGEYVPRLSEKECWPYRGARQRRGDYGRFMIYEKPSGRCKRAFLAHRIAYFLTHSEWPEEDICHTCDNPPCCNPHHLFKGTQSDNMRDAADKGRIGGSVLGRGTERPNSKLNDEAVRYIRQKWGEGQTTRRELAEMFDVSQGAIQQVTDRTRWRHID